MESIRKKVGKILLSLTMVFTISLFTQEPVQAASASYNYTDLRANKVLQFGDVIKNNSGVTVNVMPYDGAFSKTTLNNGESFTLPNVVGVDAYIVTEKTSIGITLAKHSHFSIGNTWEKNENSHWKLCYSGDGTKVNMASHTFSEWVIDTPATETTKGSKHRDCNVCAHRETVEIPVPHVHVPATTWSKDNTNHWHACTANDGEKMDLASHTFGKWVVDTPATETKKGSKHRDCNICARRVTVEIPAIVVTPEKPVITAGAGSTHQISSEKNMTLTCSGKLELLTGIYVDGKIVDKNNYTLKSGSTILTLKASYLDTLSAGKHTLKFQYKDNLSAVTNFTITAKATPKKDPVIKDTDSPKTGDTSNLVIFAFLLLLSGCGIGTIAYKRKNSI